MAKRLVLVSLLGLVPAFSSILWGDCVVEGTVQSPVKTIGGVCPPGRYAGQARQPAASPPLARVAVFLEGQFNEIGAPSPIPYEIIQQGLQFSPAVLPIQKGARVEFPNRDDDYHNVLSYSKVKEFDLGRYLKGEKSPVIVFDRTGFVEVNCEIHEHMRAYILVLDTPYFTTTDAEGRFKLDNLPAGNHVLKAWASPKVVWQMNVELKEGSPLRVDFPPPKSVR